MATKYGGETDFWEKTPVDYADTIEIKIFVEIALTHTVSEMNAFLDFTQKFKLTNKKWRENDFWGKVASTIYRYPVGQKFRRNHCILHHFQDKCIFAFYTEIQDGHQK